MKAFVKPFFISLLLGTVGSQICHSIKCASVLVITMARDAVLYRNAVNNRKWDVSSLKKRNHGRGYSQGEYWT